MKKIKYLLFGIVSLLGIGFSFGLGTYLDYSTLDGGQSTYYFSTYNNSTTNNGFFHFVSGQPTDYSTLNTYYYRGGTIDMSFNISDYSLSSSVPVYHSNLSFNTYYNSNGNALVYRILSDGGYSSARYQFFFPVTSTFSSLSTEDIISGNGYYIRVFGNEDCLSSDVLNSSNFCIPSFVQVFNGSNITTSSLGSYYDATFDGVNYNKGPIAPGVGYGYSFGFVTGSGWLSDGTNYYINTSNGDYFNFRTIDYVGSQSSSYNGIMAFKLNSSTLISGGNSFDVLALGITGSVDDFSLIYSVYNCPSSSTSLNNCSFSYGGDTNFSHLSSSDLNTSTNFGKFLYYLTSPDTTRKLNNYHNINDSITHIGDSVSFFGELLYKYWGYGSYLKNTYLYSLTFVSSTGSDIIGIIPGGDDGNQPTLNWPSYTSGQVSACRNPGYYGVAALGEGFSNPVCDEINSLIYVGEDENGNSIYVYYNDDGSWWVRTMGEANLTSVSAPSGFEIDSSGNVSTIWEVVCTGNFCDDYLSGLKAEDIEKYRYVNIEFGDAIILNTGYYENFFSSLNLTGYVFKCPYTYSNSRFVLGKNIIKKLGGYDPFLPVNCFIAAFENGRRVQFFDDAFGGFNRGPLMDGDTQNHNNLFTFFDILLSIGLIFFLMKFYHLFK